MRIAQLKPQLFVENNGFVMEGRLHPSVGMKFTGGPMHKCRISVLYRENCGGILRNLAAGLRRSVSTLAELDLYEDLRERIFREDTSFPASQKNKSAA